jgi:hypothetical protein
VFGLARFNPQSDIAPVPVYEEPERVASFVRAKRVPPRATPEIVEFAREALGILEVTRAPPESESPVPVRSLNDSPFTMRFVVEAFTYEEYMVEDEYGKVILLAKVLVPDQ